MKKLILLLITFLYTIDLTLAQPDGSLDSSFNSGDVGFGYGTAAGLFSLALQPDGKILAFGSISCRLEANGDIDSSFSTGGLDAKAIAVQPDGKIVACGYFTQYQG